MADLGSIGASHRAEAERAKHRALFFAVVLVLAHLLDIRPSEAQALGLKITLADPVILYGAVALLFGYHLSHYFSELDKGEALLPLQIERRKLRMALRLTRRLHYSDKKKRKTPQTPQARKSEARFLIGLDRLVLLPYRLLAVAFVLGASAFMIMDIVGLGLLIWWSQSPILNELISDYF